MGVVAAGVASAFWYVVGTTTAIVATTTGIALSVGAATVVAAGGLAILGAAFSAVVDWAMPDIPELNSETSARLNKTLNPEEPRKMVFGETAAASDIRYWEAYGTDNKQYDEVIAVATHEIESFGNFYFETDLLSFDGSGDNTNQYGANLNKKNRTVGATGTSLSAGAGFKWTANSSMTGCAFYVLRFLYDQEVFPKGFPTRITQVVKGAKVYDPRLDSTNGGAGPHRTADQDTWEYISTIYQFVTNNEANGPWDSSDIGKDIEVAATTKTGTITSVSGTGPNYTIQYVLSGTTKTQFSASDTVRRVDATTKTMTLTASAPTTISTTDIGKNPALQILWYLLGWKINSILVAGVGVSSDDIDFLSFITAANSCDTASYEGHCTLSTGDSHERNLSLLRSSCGGTLIDTGGRYSFHPAIDDTGVIAATFDENDIAGPFSWVPKAKMRGQFNEVAGSFINPSVLYQTAPYPKVEDAAYVSADGFSKRRTVDFQTIQDSAQAQKLARILLNRTRFQGVFQASFNYKAMLVKNWDIVQLSFSPLGWTNELFRVVQQSITTDGQIVLTLRQESSAIYAGGTINPALPTSAGSAWDASAKIPVTSLSTTPITETGSSNTISDGIKVLWAAPSSIVSFTEVQYKINADSDWIAAAVLTQGETETKIVPAESGTLYDTRVRHISIASVVGDFSTDTVTTGTNRDTAPGATENTGALADLDTVDTAQIVALAVTNAKVDTDAISTLKVVDTDITETVEIAEAASTLAVFSTTSTNVQRTVYSQNFTLNIANSPVRVTGHVNAGWSLNSLSSTTVGVRCNAKLIIGGVTVQSVHSAPVDWDSTARRGRYNLTLWHFNFDTTYSDASTGTKLVEVEITYTRTGSVGTLALTPFKDGGSMNWSELKR